MIAVGSNPDKQRSRQRHIEMRLPYKISVQSPRRITTENFKVRLQFSIQVHRNRPFYNYGRSNGNGDLILIQTFLFYYVNQAILMLISIFQGQFP